MERMKGRKRRKGESREKREGWGEESKGNWREENGREERRPLKPQWFDLLILNSDAILIVFAPRCSQPQMYQRVPY